MVMTLRDMKVECYRFGVMCPLKSLCLIWTELVALFYEVIESWKVEFSWSGSLGGRLCYCFSASWSTQMWACSSLLLLPLPRPPPATLSPTLGWTISQQLGTKGNTIYFRLILLDVLSEQQEKKVIQLTIKHLLKNILEELTTEIAFIP